MIQAQAIVLETLGLLSWDLPAQKAYAPNTELPFTLKVKNPTAAARQYGLQAQALIQGEIVWYSPLLVDSQEWFTLNAGEEVPIQGSFSADQTSFTFAILLIDQATNSVVASVSTNLVGAAAPTPTPTPAPTTDIMGQIAPLLTLAMFGMMIPMMTSMTKGMVKKKE